jgi:hypothetical protein
LRHRWSEYSRGRAGSNLFHLISKWRIGQTVHYVFQ